MGRKVRGLVMVVAVAAVGLLTACTTTEPVTSTKVDPASGQKSGGKAAFSRFTDLPVPDGAQMNIARTLILGSQERWIGRLVLETGTNATEIFDFYQGEMPNFGWAEVTAVRAETSVLTFSRDERIATIQIRRQSLGGTSVDITMSPRGGS